MKTFLVTLFLVFFSFSFSSFTYSLTEKEKEEFFEDLIEGFIEQLKKDGMLREDESESESEDESENESEDESTKTNSGGCYEQDLFKRW